MISDYEMHIWNGSKSTLKHTVTPTSDFSPNQVDGLTEGWTWIREGNGNCKKLEFKGRANLLPVEPADIIQLRVYEENDALWHSAFYGVITSNPPSEDALEKSYIALGEELLNRSEIEPLKFTAMDTGALARHFVENYRHVGLSYDPLKIPDTASVVNWNNEAPISLFEGLQSLKQVTLDTFFFGVDEDGFVFFKETLSTQNTSLDYALSGLEEENIQSKDFVTKANVIYADGRPSRTPLSETADKHYTLLDFSVEDPLFATKPYEKSFLIPAGIDATSEVIPPVGEQISTGMTNPNNAFDGNDATFATSNNVLGQGLGVSRTNVLDFAIGVLIEYTADSICSLIFDRSKVGTSDEITNYPLLPTPTFAQARVFDIPSRKFRDGIDEERIRISSLDPAVNFSVKSFKVIYPDTSVLQKIALSNISLPQALPASIRSVDNDNKGYYRSPTPYVELTAAPSGTLLKEAPTWSYTLKTSNVTELRINLDQKPQNVLTKTIDNLRLESMRTSKNALLSRMSL